MYEIRGETVILNRDLRGRASCSRRRRRWRDCRVTSPTSRAGSAATTRPGPDIIESELASAYQELTDEMKRLQKQPRRRPTAVGGIPVDSEYVVFVIDTSSSMQRFAWPLLLGR